MARRGRSRKHVKREGSGRGQRVPVSAVEDVKPTPEMDARRIDAMCEVVRLFPKSFLQKHAPKIAKDPDVSWYVGRLFLVGEITQPQRDAAREWLEIARAYEAMLLAPKRPGALDLNRIHGEVPDFESDEERRRFRRLKGQYDRRWNLVAEQGHDVLRATTRALKDAEAPVALVRRGLAALVRG